MKILYVDLESAWRGGQNQALLTMQGVAAQGHEAQLVTVRGSELGQRAGAAGIAVTYVRKRARRWSAAMAIRLAMAKGGWDVVHANEAHAVSAVWLASLLQGRRGFGAPLVVARRVGYPLGKSWIARAKYAGVARMVANSRWVAERAEEAGMAGGKLEVIYEGTKIPEGITDGERNAARERWGIARGAPVLGCVGVLLPDKGQAWLIRATAALREEFPEIRLLLAGDGKCRGDLEQLAANLGMSKQVIFAGFVSEVRGVYAALDLFLLPSFFEALNNSLLGAMAHGIPSIAFNLGALGEIMEDGQSGLLVSGTNVEEIADAIVRVLRDRELGKRLGTAGRLRVQEKFSAERMIEGTLKVYADVLQEAKNER